MESKIERIVLRQITLHDSQARVILKTSATNPLHINPLFTITAGSTTAGVATFSANDLSQMQDMLVEARKDKY